MERPELGLRLPGKRWLCEGCPRRGGPAYRKCPGRGQCLFAAGGESVSAEFGTGGGGAAEASQLPDVLLMLVGQGKPDELSRGVVLERAELPV